MVVVKLFSFSKKRGAPVSARVPTERVTTLSSQGFSEPEIIRQLRTEGYKPQEVDMAMKSALRASAAPSRPAEPFPPAPSRRKQDLFSGRGMPEPEMPEEQHRLQEPPFLAGDEETRELGAPGVGMPAPPGYPRSKRPERKRRPVFPDEDIEEDVPIPADELEEDIPPIRSPAQLPQRRPAARQKRQEELEEMTEGVVEEKWREMKQEMEDLDERLRALENKLAKTDTEGGGMRSDEVTEIKNKIDAYHKSISEVNSRMEGVERVVKDSLTPMMQSMRSLSEVIRALKVRRAEKA